MKAHLPLSRRMGALLSLLAIVALPGCSQNPVDPQAAAAPGPGRVDAGVESWRRDALSAQIGSATLAQALAIASCLPSDAGLPPVPDLGAFPTLSEIVAATPQIVRWKQAVTDYVQLMPLHRVIEITPCVVRALQIAEGSPDSARARHVLEALQNAPWSQLSAVAECLGPAASLPAPPDLDPNASLSEIVRRTAELTLYRDAVVAYVSHLPLSQVVSLTPCLAHAGLTIA